MRLLFIFYAVTCTTTRMLSGNSMQLFFLDILISDHAVSTIFITSQETTIEIN